MHSGETFDEVIERNLRAAKAVLVLWSPRSVTSRWVRAEATQADRANKLVPAKIEACELPIIFELTHTAELLDWTGDRSDSKWDSLVKDLRRLIGPAAEEVVAKPETARAEPVKADKSRVASSEEEIAKALECLANVPGSILSEPTPAEQAQAKFFQESDAYREEEGETVHCLRRVHADASQAYHIVPPSGLKIGRTAAADVILFEPGVSRQHCLVELAADKLRVMDLNSTNGTYIDDKRIGEAEILPVGSVLRVGNIAFEHEVRTRAELRQLGDAISLNPGAVQREPRVARSS